MLDVYEIVNYEYVYIKMCRNHGYRMYSVV